MEFFVNVLAPSWCTGFFIINNKVVDLLSAFRAGAIELSQSVDRLKILEMAWLEDCNPLPNSNGGTPL